jgi:hypothetical protein
MVDLIKFPPPRLEDASPGFRNGAFEAGQSLSEVNSVTSGLIGDLSAAPALGPLLAAWKPLRDVWGFPNNV